MSFGIVNTAYTVPYGKAEGYKKMKSHGYGFADYQHFIDTETEFFKSDAACFERAVSEERRIAESEGIAFSQAHGPWRYPPADLLESDRAIRLEEMKRSIYGTAVLGCKNWVIHPLMPFGANSDEQTERMLEINRETFAALCDHAKTLGVDICIENMPFPKLPLATVGALIRFTDELKRDNFKICLDTGHCSVCGESPADAALALGTSRLVALHIHDNDGSRDQHRIPFMGKIDWNSFGKALKKISFEGAFSLECVPNRAADMREEWEKAETELIGIAKRIAESR